MAGKVFISYRREDDPSAAARVRDALAARFGKARLFMDVDSLAAGQRFDQELAKALTACDVFIAIIGSRWMDLLRSKSQMSGLRDYVREEIALALRRKIVVVPVRVGSEGRLPPLPRPKDLPSDIRDLVHYQKHDVVHERFARDVAELADVITRVRRSSQPKPAFPWVWTGAAISIVLSLLLLTYTLRITPGIWAPSAKMQATVRAPTAPTQTTVSAPQPPESEAAREWSHVDKSSVTELETFLRRHGTSPEADYARVRLAELNANRMTVARQECEQKQGGNPNRAIRACSEVLREYPKDADALTYRGSNYYVLREFDLSIADLDKAIEIDPNSSWRYLCRGAAFKYKGDLNRAIADHNKAIALGSNQGLLGSIYLSRGETYFRMRDGAKAIADLSKAIELMPQSAQAYNLRGSAYANLGQREKAIADFRRVLALDSSNQYSKFSRDALVRLGA